MKNNSKTSKKAEQKIKEQWDFYFNKNKDVLTAINLALKDIAPIKDKPNLADVRIRANNPHTDSLSYKKEQEILIKIEKVLANRVKANKKSIHMARQTGVRDKHIYFYCSDTALFKESVSKLREEFADYQIDVDFHDDKRWKAYFGLYPSERQFQSMRNRHVIDQLIKMGDNLSEPREVDHLIFFKSKAERKRFLKKAEKQSFSLTNKFTENSIKDHPYGLLITRVDKVDWENVDEYVLLLWELAKKCNGFYDGWETLTKGSPPVGFMGDFEDYKG